MFSDLGEHAGGALTHVRFAEVGIQARMGELQAKHQDGAGEKPQQKSADEARPDHPEDVWRDPVFQHRHLIARRRDAVHIMHSARLAGCGCPN